jgi:uncharacterized protein YggE
MTTLVQLGQSAEPSPLERTISVSGSGTASAPPDMATVQTGVTTKSSTAKEALAANNREMEKVMQVLREKSIEDRDIQTSGFSVYPDYRRDNRGRSTEISGYVVSNQLRVRVRNLSRLGEILDALVQAGSNQLSGVTFGIDKPRAVMNQARKNAVDDARGRAELYAQATGTRVGRILSISEQTVQMPRPQFQARAMAMEAASSVPVATGEQEISATINVVYALED